MLRHPWCLPFVYLPWFYGIKSFTQIIDLQSTIIIATVFWGMPTFCSSLGRLSSLGALSVAVEAEAPSLAAFWIWPWLTRFCRFSRAWASSRRRDGGQFAGCSTDRDEAWCSSRRREAEALAPPASAMAYCCTLIHFTTPQSIRARAPPPPSLPTRYNFTHYIGNSNFIFIGWSNDMWKWPKANRVICWLIDFIIHGINQDHLTVNEYV